MPPRRRLPGAAAVPFTVPAVKLRRPLALVLETLAALVVGLLLALPAAVFWLDRNALRVEQPVLLEIQPGESISHAAYRLAQQGHLRPRQALTAFARVRDTAAVQAGEYRLEPGLQLTELLDKFNRGDVVRYAVTLVEGSRFTDALEQLRAHPAVRVTLPELTPQAVMTALGEPERHPEGALFPSTYHFTRGTSALRVLEMAHTLMQQELAAAWQARASELEIDTPEQALVLASIIEKETGAAAERRRIAGVLHRRLQRGMPLQVDASVIYGIGAAFDGDIRRRDLRTDTPYNTYTRRGLPPTPICLPGRAALRAAVDPAPGDSLYFVARGDGTHVFSATLREHNRAVRQYQLGGQAAGD